ncbi:hypothetical protein GA0115240_129313 [Streptomyces sp. DvalAA-14]|uniref:hypothetical protein n=1 Tax=unclassified Streptomyces TaxID=2593676 RepID=UPI00081B2D59|nr:MULTISPECIES: hypothetical protein [unclassified Streptomyces]MYS21339.1 hypothetical protein [Streptomyces sp. SID4948]SCD90149.1 hypothetical protein GA0115240_129313 [Streptomyces sp. DvalAA-14]
MSIAPDSESASGPGRADGTPPGESGTEGATSDASAVEPSGGTSGASGQLVFDDPFDRPSSDDSDGGWGGSFSGTAEDDFTRFLNEKPPHHL